MKRQLLIGGLVVTLGGAAWFVMAGDGGGRGRGGARTEGANVGKPVGRRSEAALAEAAPVEVADGALLAAPTAARETRTSLSAEALARGVWVTGMVVFPPGTPADECVFVEARGKKDEDGEHHEVAVASDGAFRVAFGEGTKSGRLALRGRYLYLEGGARWKESEPGPIVLEPQLGARLEGRVLFPEGERAGKEDRVQLKRTRKTGSDSESEQTSHELDAEGRIEIGGIALTDEYELAFDGERCFGATGAFTLEPGRTSRHELTLERGVVLAGRVTDEAGAPVGAGAVNGNLDSWGSEFDHRYCDLKKDGSFRLKALRPGKTELTVHALGFTEFRRELGKLVAGEDQELVLVLARGGSVSGTLLWPDGSPAVGFVSVDEGDAFGGAGDGQKSAEDGHFTVTGLEAETVTVRARATEIVEVAVTSELTGKARTKKQKNQWNAVAENVAVGTQDLVLTLAASLELVGTVVEEGAGPVDAFRLMAFPVEEGPMQFDFTRQVAKAFKETGGAFTLPGFTPGKWRVTASSKEYVDSEPLEVELPASAPVTLVLRRGARVSGVVVNAAGAPVAGASIAVEERQTRDFFMTLDDFHEDPPSDAEGRFLLTKVKPGVVSLIASANGFAPSEPLSLEVFAGRETSGVVLTVQQGGTITGEVVDLDGRAAPSAHVSLYCTSAADFHESTETETDGRFEVTGVPAGSYRVHANLESGLTLSAGVELVAGGSAHVRLAPESMNAVRLVGRVTLGGEPLAGLRLSANHQGEHRSGANAETDVGGEYELTLPGRGRYWISLNHWERTGRNSRNWTVTLDVPESGQLRHDFALPAAYIRGRVTSSAGDPLANIRVTANGGGDEGALVLRHAFTETKSDGTYELTAGTGAQRVTAGGERGAFARSAWATAEREDLVLAPGQVLSGVDFVLARGGRLTGRVHKPDGSLAGAVGILDATTQNWLGSSDADGTFDLGGLAAGPLELEVQDDEGVTARPVLVTIVPGETVTVELELVPVVVVRVTLPGVPTDAEPEARVTSASGRTREAWFHEGLLHLPPLPRGTYTLTVELDEKRAERTFELRGDEGELEFELVLQP